MNAEQIWNNNSPLEDKKVLKFINRLNGKKFLT